MTDQAPRQLKMHGANASHFLLSNQAQSVTSHCAKCLVLMVILEKISAGSRTEVLIEEVFHFDRSIPYRSIDGLHSSTCLCYNDSHSAKRLRKRAIGKVATAFKYHVT